MHYSLCDLPIPLVYRELDVAYPGSKFVLTVRPEDDWIESAKAHWQDRPNWDDFANEIHAEIYGTPEFDEAIFRQRYRRHNAEVQDHFRNRPSDLLTINVQAASMKPLCEFLDLPVRTAAFPHKHKSRTSAPDDLRSIAHPAAGADR
jgi:hypothetical protein